MRAPLTPERHPFGRLLTAGLICLALLSFSGCGTGRVTLVSPAYSIARNQTVLPVLPFTNTLVPDTFAESVFNDFIDAMNESQEKTGFVRADIIKDNLSEVEQILSPAHVYLTGEIWSYLENAGCCATEIRVKSRLRIQRVRSREVLWETEIPLESFFEHDNSTLAVEREKLAKRLSADLSRETIKAIQGAKRINLD